MERIDAALCCFVPFGPRSFRIPHLVRTIGEGRLVPTRSPILALPAAEVRTIIRTWQKEQSAMSKEIYITSTPHETRLAIVEDEALTEVYYERGERIHPRGIHLQWSRDARASGHAVEFCGHRARA